MPLIWSKMLSKVFSEVLIHTDYQNESFNNFPVYLKNPVDGFEGDKSTHCGYSLVHIIYLMSGFHRVIEAANVFYSVIFYVLLYSKTATNSLSLSENTAALNRSRDWPHIIYMLTWRYQLLWNMHMIYIFIISNEIPGLPYKTKHLWGHYVLYATFCC